MARRPEHTEHLDYVCQALDKTPRRKNKARHARDGRMIGSIGLGADTEADPDSGLSRRRVFFLLPPTATPTPKASAGKSPPTWAQVHTTSLATRNHSAPTAVPVDE
ncbi:DUF6009 family protein [Streptomyces anulatus]|uniref:DUF6009 family protein n=1 Tax=Streptomyces anulatus TaxID=1892 RepID=UPI003F4D253A